ncbi:apoptosis regulator BAX-like [Engraulis encrasicolus]|uniref:apoptosis regulator BAX-like n=1 Tax=Engraulis encrasicolus TaxID=184585 RepID=UPI002FD2115F
MASGGSSNDEQNTTDEQITEAIMMRVLRDELRQAELPAGVAMPPLPETKPLPDKDDILTTQLAQTIKIIGDDLVKHKPLNDTIDGLARTIMANPQSFSQNIFQVAQQVFADGINWGRIVVLIYTVAKLIVKMVLARLPEQVTAILSWTLDYFKTNLLQWVIKMGGWFCSIAPITCFRIESVPGLIPTEPPSGQAIGLACFLGGIVLGSCLVLVLKGKTQH